MKVLLITAFYLFIGHSISVKEQTYYYFCVSRSIDTNSSIKTFLYTNIKDTTCNELDIKSITERWANFIKARCQNVSDCTSDLNYYKSYEDAKKQLDGFIKRNSAIHKLENVQF